MDENKIYEDTSLIQRRARNIFKLVVAIFVILIFSFWKIQILDHQKFWKKAEENRIREIILPAQRGLITDRNGVILAENIGSFKISIIRENCNDIDESCQKISPLLNLEKDILKERIDRYKSLPLFSPIVVKDNLALKDILPIEARKLELPELIIQAEPKRHYPFGTFASHVIGYILELSQDEIKTDRYKDGRLGDLVGKTGVEKQYEDVLKGTEGKKLETVDSLGRSMGEIAQREPIPGNHIKLTLDFELQKKAEELLKGREGVVVVLDPRSGEVLTLASNPDFDPNKFISRFTPEEWLTIVENPAFPLENRALRGLYSPGSVFKLVIALAGLDSGKITWRDSYYCSGSIQLYGHPFSCWYEQGHGPVNLYNGIEKSCNIYFYQLGKKMGIEGISHYAKKLGFGTKTGIDLSGEKEGLVPDPTWKKNTRNENWYPGETISVSIGQGPLMVTPVQVAVFTALIANRGIKVTPHLLMQKETGSTRTNSHNLTGEEKTIDMDQLVFENVIRGMWMAVNERGTATAAKVEGYDVCGKTGSTQVISSTQAERLARQKKKVKTHSWFTGFAPRENPEIVVTILVEHGGGGGETAAPVARQLFDVYRKKYD